MQSKGFAGFIADWNSSFSMVLMFYRPSAPLTRKPLIAGVGRIINLIKGEENDSRESVTS
jgi:hypothetical protein